MCVGVCYFDLIDSLRGGGGGRCLSDDDDDNENIVSFQPDDDDEVREWASEGKESAIAPNAQKKLVA